MKCNKTYFLFIITIIFVIFVGTVQAEQLRELSPKTSFSIDHTEEKEIVFPGTTGKLKIPAGSLNKRVNIEVQRVEISYNKKRFNRMGDVYRFGPRGLKFRKPVLLTLPYTEPADFPEEFVHIYYYNRTKNRWDVMEKIEQDMEANTITAEITHFSDYMPGFGSYSIEEGLSPNSTFNKNHNEYVDRCRGNLMIKRTDVNIPGRGVDLVVQTIFNSDWYYWNIKKTDWYWETEREEKGLYKIANGWHFNFPAVYWGGAYFGEDSFIYFAESGIDYSLGNAISLLIGGKVDVMDYVDGYRIYNETYTASTWPVYTRIIEIIREKIVLECDVIKISIIDPPITTYKISNVKAYLPDGRIIEFYDPQDGKEYDGKVHKIYDASKHNNLTFTYDEITGKIESITDSIGRILHFDYGTLNTKITLYLQEGSNTNYLVEYTKDDSELIEIKNLKHDNSGIMVETEYDYTTTSPYETTIIYPSGGESIYTYSPKFCGRINGIKKRPMIKKHELKVSATSPPSETRTTTYTYYNKDDLELEEGDDPSQTKVAVHKTKTIISAGIDNEPRKIITKYAYEYGPYEIPRSFKGEWLNVIYIYDQGWILDRITKNDLFELVPEYFLVDKTYKHLDPTSELILGDYSYYFKYDYDWYGQTIMEKKVDDSSNVLKATYYDYVYSYSDESPYGNGDGVKVPFILSLDSWNDVEDNQAIALDRVILNPEFDTSGHNFNAEILCSDEYDKFKNDPYDYRNYADLRKHGFGLIRGIVNKQSDSITQEIYYNYYTNSEHLRSIKNITKKKTDGDNTEWITTSFDYDDTYNNLIKITDPEGNEINLNYNSTHNYAYITRESRTIDMDYRDFDGCNIVNRFSYDDLGRMSWKRTYYEENGSPKAGYKSDFTHYTYDDLDNIITVKTSETKEGTQTPRMTYTYDYENNTMKSEDEEDNVIIKHYDGLDRVIIEEVYKSITTRISKKEYEYHPIFIDKVTKTAIYKDSSHTETHILETLYDQYERPVTQKINGKTVKKIIYNDLNNYIVEKYFRDDETTPTFSQKRMDKDWNGNTVKIKEWKQTNPGSFNSPDIITKYTYDLVGNCTNIENDSGEIFVYKINSLGQVYCAEYDDGTYETFTYDKNGNMVEMVDRCGNTLVNIFDTINMLRTEKTYNSSDTLTSKTKIDYGQYGTPVVIDGYDDGSTILYRKEYTYNGLAQITEYNQYDQYASSSSYEKLYSIENTYDAAGNLNVTKLREGTVGSGELIKALDYDPVDQDTRVLSVSMRNPESTSHQIPHPARAVS